MSEYWKSNPRKFCDFCKCWIADNRPSIDFHERGKRHNENVQKRLEEIGKKGKEDYENKLKEKDYFLQMEQAALESYKKDIEKAPDMTGQKISNMAAASNATIVVKKKDKEKSKKEKKVSLKVKNWMEAKSPEGYSYYYNKVTEESQWEEPPEGFISLDDQNASSQPKNQPVGGSEITSTPVVYGPAPKAEAFGKWQTVQKDEENQINLQLPTLKESDVPVYPEMTFMKEPITFKEKTVTLSSQGSSQGQTSFKRKNAFDHKKHVRRRNEDL